MVWLTERRVFALLRFDTDYFAAMYSYTITFGPFGPVTCNPVMHPFIVTFTDITKFIIRFITNQ